MSNQEILDEAYARFHRTGPEFEGWLSNHGPMAADALIRMGRDDAVSRWVDGYIVRLEAPPESRWAIGEDWRESLGDASRLGDWLSYFTRESRERPWRDLVALWWPRLLPGAPAAATHGLIRTGHAVRALLESENPQRVDELAQALGYWAARWQPLNGARRPSGSLSARQALEQTWWGPTTGGFRTRFAALSESTEWAESTAALQPVSNPDDVPNALQALTDAAVDNYLRWGHGSPIMLVHAATAPRAAALVLPVIPREQWVATYDTIWSVSAGVASAYRAAEPYVAEPAEPYVAEPADVAAVDVIDRAVDGRDEHAIKFVEVAIESNRRGLATALAAAARANSLITGVS